LSGLSTLAQGAARLLVSEVRRRASNQSTEEASAAIAGFMEIQRKDHHGDGGWMLLSAINILCGENDEMADLMTAAAVPSTLVKWWAPPTIICC